MNIVKKLLASVGLGIMKAFGRRKVRVSPFEREQREFEADVRKQLLKLKEKGLSLPVMTL